MNYNTQMKKIVLFAGILFSFAWINQSCERAIEQNIGNSYVLMSRSNMLLNFTDTIRITGVDTLYATLKDTTVKSIGVYRSGLSSSYPEIDVTLKVDSIYLKSMIQQANDPAVPDVQKSSAVLSFKNSVLLPSNCYQFSKTVRIEKDRMVGDVMVVISKSKFARLKASKVFLPVAIDTLATHGVNTARAISVVQVKNGFVFKKQ
jgi:hypothetical protein